MSEEPQPKRAKVKLEFAEKLFYEKVLSEWKNNALHKNHSFVIKKALENLKQFPLDVNGFVELKKIRGIGEDIATRLDAAWKNASENFFDGLPTLDQVKELGKGQAYIFLESSASGFSLSQKSKKFITGERENGVAKKSQSQLVKEKVPKKIAAKTTQKATQQKRKDFDLNVSCSQPIEFCFSNANDWEPMNEQQQCTSTAVDYASDIADLMLYQQQNDIEIIEPSCSNSHLLFEKASTTVDSKSDDPFDHLSLTDPFSVVFDAPPPPTFSSSLGASVQQEHALSSKMPSFSGETAQNRERQPAEEEFVGTFSIAPSIISLTCNPDVFRCMRMQVTLVVDEREKNAGARSQRKTMGEHLLKLGVLFETRVLSAGDYLWIIKLPDGEEMVLDYIVERKTWDDLKRSIYDVRYKEQKRRLVNSGIKNVILVVEGKETTDSALKQAMLTTSVHDKFLTHRTQTILETAKFLGDLTDYLKKRCSEKEVCGPSFSVFQAEAKKPRAVTVGDCWLMQLAAVVPGMSVERAKLVAERFPSFRLLTEFYRSHWTHSQAIDEALLHRELPQLPMCVSRQLYRFFRQDLRNQHGERAI